MQSGMLAEFYRVVQSDSESFSSGHISTEAMSEWYGNNRNDRSSKWQHQESLKRLGWLQPSVGKHCGAAAVW